MVQTAPGEVYTALERGVVDGYGWPITGIFDLGWQEKTKYRVDPGFYTAEVSVLVNKSDLGQAERRAEGSAARRPAPKARRKRRPTTSPRRMPRTPSARPKPASRRSSSRRGRPKSIYDKAYEAGWAGIIKQSPEHGPKLKEFFSKPKVRTREAVDARPMAAAVRIVVRRALLGRDAADRACAAAARS